MTWLLVLSWKMEFRLLCLPLFQVFFEAKDVLSIYFSLVSGLMSAYVVVSFSIETFAPSAPVAERKIILFYFILILFLKNLIYNCKGWTGKNFISVRKRFFWDVSEQKGWHKTGSCNNQERQYGFIKYQLTPTK